MAATVRVAASVTSFEGQTLGIADCGTFSCGDFCFISKKEFERERGARQVDGN